MHMRAEIGGRAIGRGAPMFVIAELGLNHNGSVAQALHLVDEAAAAGASAVKMQVFDADRLIAAGAPGPAHLEGASLQVLFRQFELDLDACAAVAVRARRHGLAVLATAFDEDAVQGLDRIGVDAFKIASGDLTHVALIEAVAQTRRPVVLSTGMSTVSEVANALDWAVGAGARCLALLHCVSAYPTPDDQQNLGAISRLLQAFHVPVGLSDHGMGRDAALIAYALGGTLYERHFCIPGTGAIDEPVSSSPEELADIVRALSRAHAALGHGRREPQAAELANVVPSRRGLYAARPLSPGDLVTAQDIVALRPAEGLGAEYHRTLVGCRLVRPIAAGTPFTSDDLVGAGGGGVS
jgi:N,N'-diacetyllegionaminate synthase